MWTKAAITPMVAVFALGEASLGAVTLDHVGYSLYAQEAFEGGGSAESSFSKQLSTGNLQWIGATSSLWYKADALRESICGKISVQCALNYDGPASGATVDMYVYFSTDSEIAWSSSRTGYIQWVEIQTPDGTFLQKSGGVLGPGSYRMWGFVHVGNYYSNGVLVRVSDCADIYFAIPAPSAVLTLLGAGFIASARRRRTD
jgi:hypothetical protein